MERGNLDLLILALQSMMCQSKAGVTTEFAKSQPSHSHVEKPPKNVSCYCGKR